MTNTYSDVAVEALAERFRELQAENKRARRWARAWKATARYWRHVAIDGKDDLNAAQAKSERLREALEAIFEVNKAVFGWKDEVSCAIAMAQIIHGGTPND